jgi:hypothetical protein
MHPDRGARYRSVVRVLAENEACPDLDQARANYRRYGCVPVAIGGNRQELH